MNISQVYILISIVVIAIVMIVLILTRKKIGKPLSKLTTLSFLFIIMGIIFAEDRLIGYSLMGVGVIIAIFDIIKLKRGVNN